MFNFFGNSLKSKNIEEMHDTDFMDAFAEENSNILIDVRTKGEFRSGYIPKAINLDISSHNFIEELTKMDKTKNYFVYCRSGMRSSSALKKMRDLGFENRLVNLKNGILGYTGKIKV